jgi:hypothetical protein
MLPNPAHDHPVFDPDPTLRRLERNALLCTAVALAVALVARGGRTDVALGVGGGALLAGLSYWAIRASVDALVALVSGHAGEEDAPPRFARIWLGLAGRYALLGLMAYGMIARLRLSPVGLFIGVSAPFAAVCVEAARETTRRGRPPHA